MHTNNNRISTPAIIRQSAVENVPDMWMPLDLNISHVNIFGKDTVIPPQFSTGSAQNVGIHNMQDTILKIVTQIPLLY
ncbi:hypothetical protein MXB_4971 [Myxobolus squamalis]|nr:hypothetical protein MXB_4971 [Myxobolus squamalis]